MTKAQVKNIIVTTLGYKLDKIIDLKKVSSIYTTLDANFFPASTTRFKFTNSELLYIYNGQEILDNEGNIVDFVNDRNESVYNDESVKPNFILPFSVIGGFLMVGYSRPIEPFRMGRMV